MGVFFSCLVKGINRTQEAARVHILYLINSMHVGGAEASTYNLVRHLRDVESNFEIDVVTLYEAGYFGQRLRQEGFSVRCLAARSKYDLAVLPRLASLVRDGGYHLAHAHLFPACYIAAFCSCFAHQPTWIYSEHSIWNRRRRYAFLRLIDRAVYERFTGVVAVSEMVRNSLLEWLPFLASRLSTIPNGVVLPVTTKQCRSPVGHGTVQLLFAGRLEPVKGVDLLLEALAGLAHTKFRLLVAGDGSQGASLKQMAVNYRLEDKVEFLGIRHDLQDLMRSADCLVAPSRWEGLPMVILEAMALGLPVAASSVGGIPEVVEHGVSGYLFPPGDVSSLRQQLEKVIEQPQVLPVLGKHAQDKVAAVYSIQTVARRFADLYNSVARA